MCPPACFPRRLDININSTDDEVLSFLGGMKAGDPVPSNVITEVNPFSVEPWDSPVGKLYLYNFEVGCSSSQPNTFKAIQTGYWRFVDRLTIYRGNVAAGRKTTWEFYKGQEPLGNRTGWLMYDYQRVQKACQGISAVQDCNSMCRVFLQEDQKEIINDQKSPDTEHCNFVSSDNADDEHVESCLRILQSEESSSPTNAANPSEFGAPKQRQDRSIQDLPTSDSTANLNAIDEFSMGEYLELDDLYELESTSSSSDDSTLISSNSDDCFDAEALLGDLLENESSRIINGSNEIDHTDSVKDEPVLADPSPVDGSSPKTTSPAHESKQKFSAASTSEWGSSLRGHPKRTHSGSSESSSGSNGSGSKSAARIAKLKKKYCCFSPF